MFVPFDQVKERVSFEDAINKLGLQLKQTGNQWRGACPACKNSGDRALVITEGRGYFCFSAHKGGDQIGLAAHVLGIQAKDAAQFLIGEEHKRATVPESAAVKEGQTRTLQPLPYLEHEHEAVIAIGFDVEIAKRLGIGYASKGLM